MPNEVLLQIDASGKHRSQCFARGRCKRRVRPDTIYEVSFSRWALILTMGRFKCNPSLSTVETTSYRELLTRAGILQANLHSRLTFFRIHRNEARIITPKPRDAATQSPQNPIEQRG